MASAVEASLEIHTPESPLETSLDLSVDTGLESPLQSALHPSRVGAEEALPLEEVPDLREAEVLGEVDRTLAALCRERSPLRAVLARIAARLVSLRAWERLGYARLSDYAVECLGLSARSVRSLAEVGARLGASPRLEDALVSGRLGWTKVRILARLPRDEDEVAWIAYARHVTAEDLSKAVRAVDCGSVEAGAAEEASARSRLFEVRCSPEVRWKWVVARGAARRAAGRVLHVSEAAELIAAEVLSALPIDEQAEDGACEEAGVSWSQQAVPARDEARDTAGSELCGVGSVHQEGGTSAQAAHPPWRGNGAGPVRLTEEGGTTAHTAVRFPSRGDRANSHRLTGELRRPSLPPTLQLLVEGLEEADAFSLDERLRRALSLEQRLDARIGALLALLWGRFVHRALGYPTREAYARDRLGMDPTRARALVRLERAAVSSDSFARAYRRGELSWVKADLLVPLVSADPLGWFVEDWVVWAGRVTVRRLSEDVEHALALAETDPVVFRRSGGLPPEARPDREIGATRSGAEENIADPLTSPPGAGADREIGATPMGPVEEHAVPVAPGWGTGTSGTRTSESMAGDGREIGATPIDPWLNRRPGPPKSAPDEVCFARFFGPPDVVQLFRAVLCTVRRRMERETGRLPTAGQALGAMLDHVLGCWGALDDKLAARHTVFARDGWRCAVPGCTSMQNLHDHHIRFRSAAGSNALDNRITLCAFHHLRGVHAGLLRCVGRAPDGLRWEMGIRPGVTPLLAYRSGDLRVPAID